MPYADSIHQSLPFSEPDTSRDAAQRAAAFAGRQQRVYLTWLRGRAGGGTDRECAAETGLARASICARRDEAKRAGLVVKTAERRDGCAVWAATW